MTRLALLFLLTLRAFNQQHPSSSRVMDRRLSILNNNSMEEALTLESSKIKAKALGSGKMVECMARP